MASVSRLRLETSPRRAAAACRLLVVLLAVVLWAPLSTAVPSWFGYAR